MKAQGDAVSSGDVLARFELPSATQDVARLAADLASAQAQLENARVNQGRVRDFVDKGLVPRRDLDTADRELEDAQAAVNRIRTAHAAAESAAARAVIRAPFNGIVVERRYAPGDVVMSTGADPVLRIVDPKRLEVVVRVPETDAARVVPGASARVAGSVEGHTVRLSVAGRLALDQRTGEALPIRLVFVDETTLAVDTPIEIDIDAEERNDTVLLPAAALVRDGDQQVVFVAAGSRAERRVVTTGITESASVEIRSGVQPGELVITRGHVGLADGAAISVDAGP
jgi:RND family efflux transporter MFP subunit